MFEIDSDAGPSETGTESSSGLGNYDVAMYFHHTICDKAVEAEKILIEDGITSCLSYRDAPAGRPKLANLYSVAKRSFLRVFIITDKFVREDFSYHLRLLGNADMSNTGNSLLLMKRQHKRLVPTLQGDLTCGYFEDRISGEEIARLITEFMYKESYKNEEQLGPPDLTSKLEEDEQTFQECQQRYEKECLKFEEMFGKVTKKRCYILLASPIMHGNPLLAAVTSVPWVRVFDFDTRSRESGLLLWADEMLSKKNHTKTNRPDHIDAPDDNVTNWVSILGDADNADSFQAENDSVSEAATFRHGECLAEYCVGRKVPVILVMWYSKNGDMNNNLDSFLSGLRHHFMARLQSFNCIICVSEMPKKRSPFWRTLERLKLLSNVIVVPASILCSWLQSACSDVTLDQGARMTLPKYPNDGVDLETVEIQSDDLAWIRSQLYILVTSEIMQEESRDSKIPKHISSAGSNFLKGREINWNVIEYGGYDVCRELLGQVKKYIEDKHLSTGKSGLVTIYHAPGGGGTTFARRLLFELHARVPSGEISSDRLMLKNLEERLLVLRNLTLLPTVLLFDGKSMIDIKRILAIGTKLRVIVIHVRRYIHRNEPSGEGKFFLRADVSSEEAEKFSNVYRRAVPQRRKQLNRLTGEVLNGKKRYIFEYGLTAFNSKFQGVKRYVHGYLQISETTELQNWHRVLVILSMADYYGHRGLPCKLFSKILGKDEREIVEFNDLPHAAQQLITESGDSWKISHYVISKLILEQVLVKRPSWEYQADDKALTPEASQELSEWALIFINNIRVYVGNSRVAPHIWEILTAVFIRRDYDDPGGNELGVKAHYSKLLEEINSSEQQKVIFKKLADSFPEHAEFRAHLGRLHSKQGEFDEAGKCFELALETRRQELRMQQAQGISGRPTQEKEKRDDVLERIYNMFAFACISHIRSKLGARMGKLTTACLHGKNLPTLTNDCVKKATEAISNFEKGRRHYQKASNPSFAHLGELKVRLQLTELAKHISNGDFESLLIEDSQFRHLGEFVLKSFHECDVLLAQCISDQSKNIGVPEEEINFCFNQFNYFFRNATKALKLWAGNDSTIHSMKCHLSILKIKLKQNRKYFRLNEDVETREEIEDFVQLCERICDTVWKKNASDVRISNYMMEWLRAIRHRRMMLRYTQKDVLSRVEKWREKEEIGTLANFYYFTLTTVMSLSTATKEIANIYSKSSHKMKEYLRKNDVIPLHMHGVNEWLGYSENPHDFNQLIHSTDLGEWKDRFWADSKSISRLQVCTGSIVFCRPHDGIITLDGGREPAIQVFFVPQKYDISLSHSRKKTRVEFYIGFNPRHLAQAFEVTILKNYPCPNAKCRTPTEVPTLGKDFDECEAVCCRCETMVKISQDGCEALP